MKWVDSKEELPTPGEWVVFWDGFNDLYFAGWYQSENLWMTSEYKKIDGLGISLWAYIDLVPGRRGEEDVETLETMRLSPTQKEEVRQIFVEMFKEALLQYGA